MISIHPRRPHGCVRTHGARALSPGGAAGAGVPLFLVVPLAFIVMVSFWTYDNYQIQLAFTLQNYATFSTVASRGCRRCARRSAPICPTLGFALRVWVLTLGIGFTIAYFLAFEVRSKTVQSMLFLLCTIPFWTSNVIRMISWIPLLGREGLVNRTLMSLGAIDSRSTGCSIPASR